jgi:hypothetical protein
MDGKYEPNRTIQKGHRSKWHIPESMSELFLDIQWFRGGYSKRYNGMPCCATMSEIVSNIRSNSSTHSKLDNQAKIFHCQFGEYFISLYVDF